MNFRNWSGFALSAVLLTGCATTGRNYQTDIDALNARINALQGQLAEKDQQVATLQTQLNDQQLARQAAEAGLKNAENEKRAFVASQSAQKNSTVSDLK